MDFRTSELQHAVNSPDFAVQLAMGPPFPQLVPQQPGSGLVLGGQIAQQPHRLIFKNAHMAQDDFRIFDGATGRVVAAMSHFGKNPYASFDPLGQSSYVQMHGNMMGEWDSLCSISGFHGMPNLRVRPKKLSRHGRQFVQDVSGRTIFNIGKESRLKEMSLRHNLAVHAGEGEQPLYRILIDLMGRTLQIVNAQEQLVCFVQKSTKALILTAALGAGSEMLIDVAPGVDWTAMVAIVLAVQQVGAHFLKDAFGNFAVNPLQNNVTDSVLTATGMGGAANQLGQYTTDGVSFIRHMQQLQAMFR